MKESGLSNSEALIDEGNKYFEAGKDNKDNYEKAINYYDEALKADSKHIDALAGRGAACRLLGRYEEAFHYLNQAVELDQSHKSRFAREQRGVVYHLLGNYYAAVEDFNIALNLYKAPDVQPEMAFVYHGRGYAQFKLNKFNEAIKDFDKALSVCAVDNSLKNIIIRHRNAAIDVLTCVKRVDFQRLNVKNLSSKDELDKTITDYENRVPKATLKFEAHPLGHGGYGEVYKAFWQDLEMDVAVKQWKATDLSFETREKFAQEVRVLANLNSRYIIDFYGICTDESPYCIVMEYAPKGSLYDVIHYGNPLSWSQRIVIAHDTAQGLAYLYSENILHCDLKSKNILIDENYRAKLADFGDAKSIIETGVKSNNLGIIGTERWKAPELFDNNDHKANKASDIYSYGVVLYELESGKVPLSQLRDGTVPTWLAKTPREELDIILAPPATPLKLAALIKHCWQQEPTKRPNIQQVLQTLYLLKEEGQFNQFDEVKNLNQDDALKFDGNDYAFNLNSGPFNQLKNK